MHAPVRNRYFYGKLLDVRHLEMEQRYLVEHRRRLNRLTIGTGVVCGLEMKVGADGKAVWIAPGFALDGCGRETVVTEPICIEDPSQLTDHCGRPTGKAAEEPVVTISLCYHECDTDPSPVLVDDCEIREGCTAGAVRERYKVAIHDGAPDGPPYPDVPLTCRLLAARLDAMGRRPQVGSNAVHVAHAGGGDGLTMAPPPGSRPGATVNASRLAGRWPVRDRKHYFGCDPPEDCCVVLGTVTLPVDDDPAEVDHFTHRRIVFSNDRLLEAVMCLAAAVERCCDREDDDPEATLKLVLVSGDAQEGKPNEALPEPVIVRVENAAGDPVGGQTVKFSTTTPLGGSFDPAQDASAADGAVRTEWTLGKEGEQTAEAALADGSDSVSLTATAKD